MLNRKFPGFLGILIDRTCRQLREIFLPAAAALLSHTRASRALSFGQTCQFATIVSRSLKKRSIFVVKSCQQTMDVSTSGLRFFFFFLQDVLCSLHDVSLLQTFGRAKSDTFSEKNFSTAHACTFSNNTRTKTHADSSRTAKERMFILVPSAEFDHLQGPPVSEILQLFLIARFHSCNHAC